MQRAQSSDEVLGSPLFLSCRQIRKIEDLIRWYFLRDAFRLAGVADGVGDQRKSQRPDLRRGRAFAVGPKRFQPCFLRQGQDFHLARPLLRIHHFSVIANYRFGFGLSRSC